MFRSEISHSLRCLALRVTYHYKGEFLFRSIERLENEIITVLPAQVKLTDRIEAGSMIILVKRYLIRGRNTHVNISGPAVKLHLINPIRVRCRVIVSVSDRNAFNPLAGLGIGDKPDPIVPLKNGSPVDRIIMGMRRILIFH